MDREQYSKLQKILFEKDGRASEDCALSLYAWSEKYGYELESREGVPCLKKANLGRWQFPLTADPEAAALAISGLLSESEAKGEKLIMDRITPEQLDIMREKFPGRFTYTENEDDFDYIYRITDLATFAGRKYSAKRNHINRFLAEYGDDWRAEAISAANAATCRHFAEKWYAKRDVPELQGVETETLEYERDAFMDVLENMDELKAEGLVIIAGGECIALAVGARISAHAADVVIEKANNAVQGAYPLIQREFAAYMHRRYPELELINRENDLGIAGMRRSKLSLYPCEILKKYTAESIGRECK